MLKVRLLRGPESIFFFFNDTATTEIYTLSLHDALPISPIITMAVVSGSFISNSTASLVGVPIMGSPTKEAVERSEEHTSELQSHSDLVCRLLLEKKKITGHATPFRSCGPMREHDELVSN